MSFFKNYIQLAKPGIIFGNLITLTGGFLLATHRQIGFEYLGLFFLCDDWCSIDDCFWLCV